MSGYRIGQRVLIKRSSGVREAIIRDFRWDEGGEEVVIVDIDPPINGPAGASLGIAVRQHQIIGPVARKAG